MGTTFMSTILYSFRRCPYAMRARLALQVSGIACELREVVLRDKPVSMLRVSPKATVPVLVLVSGQVIDESLDIMCWALEQCDPLGWLPTDSKDFSECIDLIERTESKFKFHLDRYKYGNRYDGNTEEQALHHRNQASVFMSNLDSMLRESSWLMGTEQSLADVAIAPFVRQFANVDRSWFDAQPWQALRSWLDDFLGSSLLERVMKKYSKWDPEDIAVSFPGDDGGRWRRNL